MSLVYPSIQSNPIQSNLSRAFSARRRRESNGGLIEPSGALLFVFVGVVALLRCCLLVVSAALLLSLHRARRYYPTSCSIGILVAVFVCRVIPFSRLLVSPSFVCFSLLVVRSIDRAAFKAMKRALGKKGFGKAAGTVPTVPQLTPDFLRSKPKDLPSLSDELLTRIATLEVRCAAYTTPCLHLYSHAITTPRRETPRTGCVCARVLATSSLLSIS